ncbi:PQQ-binding-like beta-propeller repeat protein [Streptomyces sp. DSM 44915]|uniref:PQQ-binding-like beta-propeller repeat protein n=1 Tax=Streptomyces chisholmiae TaxID=3075540 RepID=A0ABU2JU87_9ACTN|nr:PQQ-binding-like beta-propeller repeat protein [Streptomyces sp. DSM 44915]MDT0268326.1 PQQ-binding-like beta-propeller repeat protein [Streptomyces sp. DSM 44915]
MSQPPPNQPPGSPGEQPEQPSAAPGGGFGPPPAPGTPPIAPPLPPQGQPGQPGYGYPQPPAAPAGGYGFPQPPGGPPPGAPAGGYGFPQSAPTLGGASSQQPTLGGGFSAPTPPGPYGPGATPTAGGQSQFGAPGPYGPPGGGTYGGAVPPPPAGSGGQRRPPVWALISLVVILLAAGGGAYWFFTGDEKTTEAQNREADAGEADGEGGDSGGEAGEEGGTLPAQAIEAGLAWEVPKLEVGADEILTRSKGAWFVEDAVVRVLGNQLISYDLATGRENWTLPFELSGGDCNASPNVDDNRIAILQGRDCEVVSVVDIAAGEELTSIPLNNSITPDQYDFPAILGDTVAVSWGIGGGGYQISTGEQVWVSSTETQNCAENAYMVVEDQFISLMECGWLGEEGGSVRATDEAGNPLWEFAYTEFDGQPMEVRSVLSVEPLTLVISVGESFSDNTEQIVVVNEDRTEIEHVLEYDTSRHLAPCELNVLSSCSLGVVHDDYLYLATNESLGDNALVAFNLTTGQAEYEADAINGGAIRPFAVQDGKILAYQPADYELEGMVVALDPATEELTAVMALDRAARQKEYAMMGSGMFAHDNLPMWHENTLVLVDRVSYEEEDAIPSVLAYR